MMGAMVGPMNMMAIQNATTQVPSLPLQDNFNRRLGGASGSSSNGVVAPVLSSLTNMLETVPISGAVTWGSTKSTPSRQKITG